MKRAASVVPVHLTMPTALLLPTCMAPAVDKEMVRGEEIEAIGAAGPQVVVEETISSSKLAIRPPQFVILATDIPPCRRRQQRAASTLSIWPPSPKAPSRKLYVLRFISMPFGCKLTTPPLPRSPSRHKSSSKKNKRSRSATFSEDSEDDSEDDRHRRRHKKHSRSHRDKQHSERKSSRRKHGGGRRHRSSDSESESDSDDEHDRRRRSEKGKGKERERSRSKPEARDEKPPAEEEEEEEELWVEAGAGAEKAGEETAVADATKATAEMEINEDEEIGPAPPPKMADKMNERDYGGALLRGEGSAMAAYVQDGLRIPRRGEIGLKPDEIEAFESVGYVMSGSRHRRMNAVRMRKENQVISAEEKRGILKMQKEEQVKREGLIVGGFKEMLEEKLKTKGSR
ncbi:hypothetical protein M407DRAFT_246326 [Tulasnella calospora MUT 4182]|uniref:NF-kappa-B-activating protein C-terminal domain-containing protein n=1 Tax=Tulasnella calospora MUT 4182 TaxID=1051891 RepID=A0A0C3KC40_9AGAM|nr:hypothetical protein M407DRAFT_246326 [Tulasnella calospora MUT 4182]